MNGKELARAIATDSGSTIKDTEKFIDSMKKVVTGALIGGERVQLMGFLTLECKDSPARVGTNPQTGGTVQIPARKKVKVTVGRTLKNAINS